MKMNKNEKIFADMLDRQNRKWEYPAKKFELGDTTYRPDFFLPEEDLYIEVIGSISGYKAYERSGKLDLFRETYPKINFTVLDYLGKPYPNKDTFKFCCLSFSEEERRSIKAKAAFAGLSMKELIIKAVKEYKKVGIK